MNLKHVLSNVSLDVLALEKHSSKLEPSRNLATSAVATLCLHASPVGTIPFAGQSVRTIVDVGLGPDRRNIHVGFGSKMAGVVGAESLVGIDIRAEPSPAVLRWIIEQISETWVLRLAGHAVFDHEENALLGLRPTEGGTASPGLQQATVGCSGAADTNITVGLQKESAEQHQEL